MSAERVELAAAQGEVKELRAEVERLRADRLRNGEELIHWRRRAQKQDTELNAAEARLARVVEAGARLRRHVELLLPRDLGGAARQQVIKDLKHWVALAAAQPEEKP